jgi:HK97 family phage major capsid protein
MKKESMLLMMAAHFKTFTDRIGVLGVYEKREEPTIKSVADAIDKIATAFEEYKKTNDQRLEAIKSGSSTADFDAKLAKIDQEMASLGEMRSKMEKVEAKLSRPGAMDGGRQDGETQEESEYRSAFIDWVRAPNNPDRQQRATAAQKALESKKASMDREGRAAQTIVGTGAAGGFAVPESIEREIARLGVDISPLRQLATVRQVGTTEYSELFDVNGATFEWGGEGDTRNKTNTPDLKNVSPTFGMATAKPQASEESLDDIFFNVEEWLVNSAAEAISQGEGAAFVSGSGVKKPTGFMAGAVVATADATREFGVLQSILSGNAAALPTSLDGLLDMVYSLRARYRRNATWMANRLVLAALRKYKGADGQYMWQPSLVAGQPDLFMGYAVAECEDMPNVAANAYPLAFGDFKEGYLIADRVGLRITRDEVTEPGTVKFYVRKRVGGILRNSQAIKLLKIAA